MTRSSADATLGDRHHSTAALSTAIALTVFAFMLDFARAINQRANADDKAVKAGRRALLPEERAVEAVKAACRSC